MAQNTNLQGISSIINEEDTVQETKSENDIFEINPTFRKSSSYKELDFSDKKSNMQLEEEGPINIEETISDSNNTDSYVELRNKSKSFQITKAELEKMPFMDLVPDEVIENYRHDDKPDKKKSVFQYLISEIVGQDHLETTKNNEKEHKTEKEKYNKIFDIIKIHRLESFMFCMLQFHYMAVIHNIIIIPIQCLFGILQFINNLVFGWILGKVPKKRISKKLIYNVTRIAILITNAIILKKISNPSTIYHWIRGQSLFKLYMIKAVNEILDVILKGFGQAIIENFCRAMSRDFVESDNENETIAEKIMWNPLFDKITAIIVMIIYGTIHSFILAMEMFTMHVVLTSSTESIYSFLFYNNFGEIKITVFKKCDTAGLYQYAANDSVERFQQLIYLSNILATTSQNKQQMLNFCFKVLLSEILTDSMKHFFVTRFNKLDTTLYYKYKSAIIQQFGREEQTDEIKQYAKTYNWEINGAVFETESQIAILANFNIVPQCAIIIRNIHSFIELSPRSVLQKDRLAFIIFIIILSKSLIKQKFTQK